MDRHRESEPERSYPPRPCLSPLCRTPRSQSRADRGPEGVISHVEEELAGGAVFVRRTRHGDGAALVQQAVVCFIFDGRVGLFLLHLLVKTATLNHKARDHAVERGVVIKTTVHVVEEVFHRNRGFLAIQLQLNIPRRGS